MLLTQLENAVYEEHFLKQIPLMNEGFYTVSEFFSSPLVSEPVASIPRVARVFYSEVKAGHFATVSLVGPTSSCGYRITNHQNKQKPQKV